MRFFTILFVLLVAVSCGQSAKKNNTNVSNQKMLPSWHVSMRGLAHSMLDIMPTLVSRRGKVVPSEKRKLKKAISDLQAYSSSLNNPELMAPSKDPTLKFIARDFQEELHRVKKRSSKVSLQETQSDLRHLTRYCVACHTKTASGSSHFSQSMVQSTQGLNDIEKGQFYMAIRQFDKALVHLETGLTNRDWATNHPNEWNKAAMQLLIVTVRVHDNPNLTLEMISRLFDTKAYPKQLASAARVWRQEAKAWAQRGKKQASLDGIPDLLKKAQKQEDQLEHSGLILNLRAQARLNRYLEAGGLSAKSEQSVLYYSGILTKRLERLNFSGFAESYFKACLEIDPTTRWGQLCKKRI